MILRIRDREGQRHDLEAVDGWRAMEVIRDYGLENASVAIKAECGGACACATCHVYVEKAWIERLPPASLEEHAALDGAFDVRENSRLSCQIIMDESLDGLELTLAPDSAP